MPARAFLSSLSDGVRGDAETAEYQGVKVARFQLGPLSCCNGVVRKWVATETSIPNISRRRAAMLSALSGMLVCGLSCWPVVFELQQRMEVQSFPPGRGGVLALLVVAAGSCRRRIHSTCTGMAIRESSHAQLHHCFIAFIASLPHWLSAAHCAGSDNRSTTRRTTCEPLPSPRRNSQPFVSRETGSMIVAPSSRSPSQIGSGRLLDGDHEFNGFWCAVVSEYSNLADAAVN